MGEERIMTEMIREFFPFRMKEDVNPLDMMLRGIRMSDFFPDSDTDFKHLVFDDAVRSFNHRYMFFLGPIRFLQHGA